MKRLFLAGFCSLAWVGGVSAAIVATVTEDPLIVPSPSGFPGDRSIQMQLGDRRGDEAWIALWFDPISLTDADYVYLSFDVYRDWGDGWPQNAYWMLGGDLRPEAGAQWDNPWGEAMTFPFGWWEEPWSTAFAVTVFDHFTTLELVWDLQEKTVYSSYDGGDVHLGFPLGGAAPPTVLDGFQFVVSHVADTGTGGETLYFDNFHLDVGNLSASTRIDFDFDDFELELVDGQAGWTAGTTLALIPEPGMLAGLVGLAGLFLAASGRRR